MMKRYVVAVLVGVMALVSISCKSQSSQTLVGKWRQIESTDQMEFRADGVFHGQMKYGRMRVEKPIQGTYFVEGNHINFKLDNEPPMTWDYKFSGETLTVS